MIFKLWQKYKNYRKLQKARYLQFKNNSIYWTRIDIETIWGVYTGGDKEDIMRSFAYGAGSYRNYYCPSITIKFRKDGLFKEINYIFEDEHYFSQEEAQENAYNKIDDLVMQVNNYLELKRRYDI